MSIHEKIQLECSIRATVPAVFLLFFLITLLICHIVDGKDSCLGWKSLWMSGDRWNSFVQEELKDKGGWVYFAFCISWIHHCWGCWRYIKGFMREQKRKTKRRDEKQYNTAMDDRNFRQDKPQARTDRICVVSPATVYTEKTNFLWQFLKQATNSILSFK